VVLLDKSRFPSPKGMAMFKKSLAALIFLLSVSETVSAEEAWYTGDERCVPPKDDGTYSAPYKALDHPHDYPTFPGADKPGWSCSYERDDGVIIQFGDSRTPQVQWLSLWGGDD